jgi:hypothetical protein
MKFLLRPEFLTAVAAWVCALGVHFGWDLPAELVYGGASLISLACGGVAVQRNKKNGNGNGKLVGVLLASALLGAAPGCKSVLDREAEVTPEGRYVQVLSASTSALDTMVQIRDAGWLTAEQEAQAKVVTRGVGVTFAAWKAALADGTDTQKLYFAAIAGVRQAVFSIEDIVRLRNSDPDVMADYTPTEEEIAIKALELGLKLASDLAAFDPDPSPEVVAAAEARMEEVKARWYGTE